MPSLLDSQLTGDLKVEAWCTQDPAQKGVAMAARVAIGDFSRMTHLSVPALRHYHEVGLLRPAEIDPNSGYRFYVPEQVRVAQVIRRFRDLAMPLEEIRAVLEAPDLATRNQVIVAHMQRMESQLAATQSVLASLRSLLEHPPAPITVSHRPVGALRAVAISGKVSSPDLDSWLSAAQRDIDAILVAAGVRPAGPRAALYSADFFQLEVGDVTAYLPVTAEVPGSSRAATVDIPAAELAVAVHRGSLAELDQTYGALGTYVAEHGIGVDGPIREHYLVSEFDTDDEADYVTEVCWPVFQTTPH
jgi:DNA-binding transcriptional MerR regulator/effector-binding domain-containing protein